MKRGVLFALLALIVLLAASSATAAAAGNGAPGQASKKGKKKGCKKKGKSKASAATSSRKKGCKKKGTKPAGTPKPEGTGTKPGATPPAAPVATWPPLDGTYIDTAGSGITLKLSGGASSASVIMGSLASFCLPGYSSKSQPTTVTATTLAAGGDETGMTVGSTFAMKWNIVVAADLSYTLTADSKIEGGPVPPCDKPGTVIKGTFYKIG